MVMLKNVWASKVVSIRTKLRIFNSNVKSVLLYGCETWRTTKTMQQKIQTFLNTCLRRIFNIRWPEKIRNEELWERAGQEPVAKQILRRKWGWIGHTLRKPASSTTRQVLTWNPQGKRKRDRPRNSCGRDTEAELYKQGTNWTGVARVAQNRVRWRRVVDGLCSTWSQGPKILLERMREAVDPMLRDQQAGFRRNRSCADQIASLRIIVEQSLEWNSPLYINFIDYEKAFDSVDREALWKLLRHYGVPGKIISLIQCTYQDMSCRIAHAGQLSESFEVKTGVRQGCLLSPFLFLLVIDWIMKTTTAGRKNGIQWTLWTQLDDLDFADDLALLSYSHSQMQDKTTRLEATSAGTGLKINRKKTELMKINTTTNTPVTVGGEPIREVESFVYLGSVVDGQGGTDRDVTARIGKARAAMVMLKNVWASKVISIRTKLRIFNSNVKSVLLYGCETWRTTKTMQQKIQTFLNTCLRRIFNIRWPEKIRNEELWERAGQEPVAKQILWRKWGWIGHTLRKPASSTTRQALTWNPQGKRKRGRPRNSWRRDTEAELCKQGTNWTGVAKLAQNRVRWRRVVDGLCSTWSQGPK
nr:hypothetical protein BaRGS_015868 [Batillaria attramentaria]